MLNLFNRLNEGLRNSDVEIVYGNEFDWEQFKVFFNKYIFFKLKITI
jgi:hypothetical protein